MKMRNAAGSVIILGAFISLGCAGSRGASKSNVVEPAASAVSAADWPMYNHDPAGWRFNAAEKTLGPQNVAALVEKWRFPPAGSKESIGVVHATPAVVA